MAWQAAQSEIISEGRETPGHAMMHHDPIAVLLRRTIETSLAGPMVPPQDGLTMSPKMFPVVMLARETARAQAAGGDLERPTGAEEDRLNSRAARAVGEVGEWRAHGSTLRRGRLRAAFRPRFCRTVENPDFSIGSASLPKKARWERL